MKTKTDNTAYLLSKIVHFFDLHNTFYSTQFNKITPVYNRHDFAYTSENRKLLNYT